jgi:hypothetical protein
MSNKGPIDLWQRTEMKNSYAFISTIRKTEQCAHTTREIPEVYGIMTIKQGCTIHTAQHVIRASTDHAVHTPKLYHFGYESPPPTITSTLKQIQLDDATNAPVDLKDLKTAVDAAEKEEAEEIWKWITLGILSAAAAAACYFCIGR